MNTDKHAPDPARVAIVQDITQCSEQAAAQAVSSLDEFDAAQLSPEIRTGTNEQGNGYASLPDILPVGKSALVAAGYDPEEAGQILTRLFVGLSEEHGGKRLYLPKADKIQKYL
jgi:Mor family transcriptional regulator